MGKGAGQTGVDPAVFAGVNFVRGSFYAYDTDNQALGAEFDQRLVGALSRTF